MKALQPDGLGFCVDGAGRKCMSLNFKMPQNITGTSQGHGIGTETVHKRAGKEKQSRFSLYSSGELANGC